MENPAEIAMRQAMMTAHDWVITARKDVNELFPDYSNAQKAVIIAGMLNAAALDQAAMLKLQQNEKDAYALTYYREQRLEQYESEASDLADYREKKLKILEGKK